MSTKTPTGKSMAATYAKEMELEPTDELAPQTNAHDAASNFIRFCQKGTNALNKGLSFAPQTQEFGCVVRVSNITYKKSENFGTYIPYYQQDAAYLQDTIPSNFYKSPFCSLLDVPPILDMKPADAPCLSTTKFLLRRSANAADKNRKNRGRVYLVAVLDISNGAPIPSPIALPMIYFYLKTGNRGYIEKVIDFLKLHFCVSKPTDEDDTPKSKSKPTDEDDTSKPKSKAKPKPAATSESSSAPKFAVGAESDDEGVTEPPPPPKEKPKTVQTTLAIKPQPSNDNQALTALIARLNESQQSTGINIKALTGAISTMPTAEDLNSFATKMEGISSILVDLGTKLIDALTSKRKNSDGDEPEPKKLKDQPSAATESITAMMVELQEKANAAKSSPVDPNLEEPEIVVPVTELPPIDPTFESLIAYGDSDEPSNEIHDHSFTD
jgi:hypothetical protein